DPAWRKQDVAGESAPEGRTQERRRVSLLLASKIGQSSMTLRVSGKNLDIGESLRQHVSEKVEAVVARYFNGAVGGHVVITREGSGYRSDCTLRLSSGRTSPIRVSNRPPTRSRRVCGATRSGSRGTPPSAPARARSPITSWRLHSMRPKNPKKATIRLLWRRGRRR